MARRKSRSPKEGLKQILALEVNDPDLSGQLQALGVETTFSNAIALAFVQRAIKGDKDAARFVREAVEESAAKGEKRAEPNQINVRALELEGLSDTELEALADLNDRPQ